MINCIKCGGFVSHGNSNLESICVKCAGNLVDNMAPEELIATAKVGFEALIDEATGYQENRKPNELSQRLKKHKGLV